MRRNFVLGSALLLASCSGGGGGGGGSSSLAPPSPTSTGGTTTSPGATAAPIPQDWTGTWDVTGTDPLQGAFSGTVSVVASGAVYNLQRLVTFQQKLPDGRDLLSAWNATAKKEAGGLRVDAVLRRGHFMKRVGKTTRALLDKNPLPVSALLQAAPPVTTFKIGLQVSGTFQTPVGAGPTETWTRSTSTMPLFPATDEKVIPIHGPPPAIVKSTSFALYQGYWTLPEVAPYVSRPEFQAAIHSNRIDRTAREFYRQRGHTCVVVLDEVVDEISIQEEKLRADAFSWKLFEKAQRFDADVKNIHLPSWGFITGVVPSTGARDTSGDGALYQGVWVASQVYRYQVTGDPEAFSNVEKGTQALCTLVDISPDKTQFARAFGEPSINRPNWIQGTGAYSNLIWAPGGNNDMLHGIDYGFLAAETVLPLGHPLRAQIATQSRSLVDNVKIAQKGSHQILLLAACARTSGDPAIVARYQQALASNAVEQLWISQGDGLYNIWGISDWSGQHLAQVDFCALRLIGGVPSPTPGEVSWTQTAQMGLGIAFTNMLPCRETLLDVAAAAFKVPGASDEVKEALAEFGCPKPTGDADIDWRVDGTQCMSPYPELPWKNDWMTNPGRQQMITGHPLFYDDSSDNHFKRSPLSVTGGLGSVLWPGQDFLHAYWLARLTGTLGPQD